MTLVRSQRLIMDSDHPQMPKYDVYNAYYKIVGYEMLGFIFSVSMHPFFVVKLQNCSVRCK